MKPTRLRIAPIALVLATLPFVSNAYKSPTSDINRANDTTISKLALSAKSPQAQNLERSLSYYKKQTQKKRQAFINLFNETVVDEDLAFVCRRISHVSTRISKEKCLPKYQWSIEYKLATKDSINSVDSSPVRHVVAPTNWSAHELDDMYDEKQRQFEAFEKEIDNIVNKTPKLRKALQAFIDAETNYETAHVQKFGSFSRFNQ